MRLQARCGFAWCDSHRVEVMDDVVAIVEGEHVEGRLDEVDGEAVVVRRVGRVDELVLPEVARHQRHGAEHGRKAERDPKRSGVVGVEGVEGGEVGAGRAEREAGEPEPPLHHRVVRQV